MSAGSTGAAPTEAGHLPDYIPSDIESRWRAEWQTVNVAGSELAEGERGAYVLEMLPYPSGRLHMGHVKNYTMGDVITHYRRRNGATVLHPMGYDSFGLPAENAAIKTGGHPLEVTEQNITGIEEDFEHMGWSIDWTRELATHRPDYYQWTQWLFLRFFEKRAGLPQGCAGQLVPGGPDGARQRAGRRRGLRALRQPSVEKRSLNQWYFRITDYAQQLLDDMDLLEQWPERVLTMQRNWIGRSEGAQVTFRQRDLG